MNDNPFTPADDGAPLLRPIANDLGAGAVGVPAGPDRSTVGVVWEEGRPGFGVIKLGRPHDPSTGEAITLGRTGANNHTPSISNCVSGPGEVSRVSIAWIESSAGDTSGMGAVMLQRLVSGGDRKSIDWAALAGAANDNIAQVTDLNGVVVVGCAPTVAELAAGDTLITWIGADGHAHGRLYPPPADADQTSADAPDHAAINAALNAALEDLGPAGPAPDGDRRLQAVELRPGALAVMWIALAEGDPVLRGSLFLSPADTGDDGHRQSWSQHAIPDVRVPTGFAGPFAVAFAGENGGAALEVTSSAAAGPITLEVLDHKKAGLASDSHHAASTLPAGPSAAGDAVKAADAVSALAAKGIADLGAPYGESQSAGPHSIDKGAPASVMLTIAATPGVNETAPLVQSVGDGFAVVWQALADADGARQLRLAFYDAHGIPTGQEILVTDNAAATPGTTAIAAFEDGLIAAYVEADDGALVVKVYAGDGTQIGQEAIVDPGDAGAIVETAVGANGPDKFAVVYVRHHSSTTEETVHPDYGDVMLQRYRVETGGDEASLVALGRDGERNGTDDAEQLTRRGDSPDSPELAEGRAPAVAGVNDGGLAIAWVETSGHGETINGLILDQHGDVVLRIDLSDVVRDVDVAGGTEPTLLDSGDGSVLLTWLSDADGGYVVMGALYRETAPGVWLAPEEAIRFKAFDDKPDDYTVAVSTVADLHFIDVIWSEDGSHGRDSIYSQRYDLDGRQVEDATKIAQGDAAIGDHASDAFAAAVLQDGQVVVQTQLGPGGDYDLVADITSATAHDHATAGAESQYTTEDGVISIFTTHVGEETAINPLAEALGPGLSISHIDGVPITTAEPVDVGFAWVQLREDGWLTVTPDVGYRGPIEFDYAAADTASGPDWKGQVVVNVEADSAPSAVTLMNQVTAVAENVSTAAAVKVADLAMADGELGTDGLSLTGLDSSMFEIVGNALYLKEGIELDFETKPTLSVEILPSQVNGFDGGINFALNVASASEAAALAAANDAFVFAAGYGDATGDHPLADQSAARYETFRDLMDSGALTQDGDNIVVTLNPDDPADLQKVILNGAALWPSGDAEFKFP